MNLCTKIRVSLAKMRPYAVLADYGGKRRAAHYSWTLGGALAWAACYNTPGALDADVQVSCIGYMVGWRYGLGVGHDVQRAGYLTLRGCHE